MDELGGARRRSRRRFAPLLVPLLCGVALAACARAGADVHRLAGTHWRSTRPQAAGFAPEATTWRFYADGSLRRTSTSDRIDSSVGAWADAGGDAASGMILIARMRDSGAPAVREALCVRRSGSRLQLGEETYEEVLGTIEDAAPVPGELADRVRSASGYEAWSTLIGAWQSRTVSPGVPSRYTFSADGSFSARGDAPGCEYAGTWSLLEIQEDRGELRMSVPAHHCDSRGPRAEHVESYPIQASPDTLRIYQAEYTREASSP